MISKIISRAACLVEVTSNPKSFFNCPDLHGGSGACPEVDLDLEEFVFLTPPATGENDRGVTASYPPR